MPKTTLSKADYSMLLIDAVRGLYRAHSSAAYPVASLYALLQGAADSIDADQRSTTFSFADGSSIIVDRTGAALAGTGMRHADAPKAVRDIAAAVGLSTTELTRLCSDVSSRREGGLKAARNMSPQDRRERARKAAEARWAKSRTPANTTKEAQ